MDVKTFELNPSLTGEQNIKKLLVDNNLVSSSQQDQVELMESTVKTVPLDDNRNTTIVVKKPNNSGGREYVEIKYTRVAPAPVLSNGKAPSIKINSIFTDEEFKEATKKAGIIVDDVSYGTAELDNVIESKRIRIASKHNSLVYTGDSDMTVEVKPVVFDLGGFTIPTA